MLSPRPAASTKWNTTTTFLDCLSHHPCLNLKYSDRSPSTRDCACKTQDSSSSSVTITSDLKQSSAPDYESHHSPAYEPLADQVARFRKLLWPGWVSRTFLVLHQSPVQDALLEEAAKFVELARHDIMDLDPLGSFNLPHMQLFPNGKQELRFVTNTLFQGGVRIRSRTPADLYICKVALHAQRGSYPRTLFNIQFRCLTEPLLGTLRIRRPSPSSYYAKHVGYWASQRLSALLTHWPDPCTKCSHKIKPPLLKIQRNFAREPVWSGFCNLYHHRREACLDSDYRCFSLRSYTHSPRQ